MLNSCRAARKGSLRPTCPSAGFGVAFGALRLGAGICAALAPSVSPSGLMCGAKPTGTAGLSGPLLSSTCESCPSRPAEVATKAENSTPSVCIRSAGACATLSVRPQVIEVANARDRWPSVLKRNCFSPPAWLRPKRAPFGICSSAAFSRLSRFVVTDAFFGRHLIGTSGKLVRHIFRQAATFQARVSALGMIFVRSRDTLDAVAHRFADSRGYSSMRALDDRPGRHHFANFRVLADVDLCGRPALAAPAPCYQGWTVAILLQAGFFSMPSMRSEPKMRIRSSCSDRKNFDRPGSPWRPERPRS